MTLQIEYWDLKIPEINPLEIKESRRSDLKKYYKYLNKCHICKEKYGSDEKEKTNICPSCDKSFKQGKIKEV